MAAKTAGVFFNTASGPRQKMALGRSKTEEVTFVAKGGASTAFHEAFGFLILETSFHQPPQISTSAILAESTSHMKVVRWEFYDQRKANTIV